jgi:hypothetical protein
MFWFLGIFYKAIMHKKGFGQDYCKVIFKKILKKFILHFLSFIVFSMNFTILNDFLEIQIRNLSQKMENGVTVLGHCLVHGPIMSTQPSRKNWLACPCQRLRVGTPTSGHHTLCAHGGLVGVSSLATPGRWARWGGHHQERGYPPDNPRGGEAYRKGEVTWRRWLSPTWRQSFNGSNTSVVVGVVVQPCSPIKGNGGEVHEEVKREWPGMKLTEGRQSAVMAASNLAHTMILQLPVVGRTSSLKQRSIARGLAKGEVARGRKALKRDPGGSFTDGEED